MKVEIVNLIEMLEEIVNNGGKVPFSNKITVDKDEVLSVLNEMRMRLPSDIKLAIDILDENYGYNRKLTDNGGYVCIIEDIKEVEYLKLNIIHQPITKYKTIDIFLNLYKSTAFSVIPSAASPQIIPNIHHPNVLGNTNNTKGV